MSLDSGPLQGSPITDVGGGGTGGPLLVAPPAAPATLQVGDTETFEDF